MLPPTKSFSGGSSWLLLQNLQSCPKITSMNSETNQAIRIEKYADDVTLLINDEEDLGTALKNADQFDNLSGLRPNKKSRMVWR